MTLLMKDSLAFFFAMFLALEVIFTSPVRAERDFQRLEHCNFIFASEKYTVVDMLECMNELIPQTADEKSLNMVKERSRFLPEQRQFNLQESFENIRYSPHSESQKDFYNQQNILNRGPQHSSHRPGYPPALPPGYPIPPSNSDFRPGIFGVNLLSALSSISQYDDFGCVPRILCEVASGVKPGSSGYKQNYSGFGMNSLISFLMSFASGTSSPLIAFSRSALIGYANKGNPDVCYRQYPRCPRNSNDLVEYLNNHNGGFFQFFNNRRGVRNEYQPDNYSREEKPQSDFEDTQLIRTSISNNIQEKNRRVIFPEEEEKSNRAAKSLMAKNMPSFFPQSRTSEEQQHHLDNNIISQKPPASIVTFFTRQKAMINARFPKLFSRKLLRNKENPPDINHGSINLKRLETRNSTANRYLDNESREKRIEYFCKMICLSLNRLRTFDRPALNISKQLGCRVTCQNIDGDKRHLSAPLFIQLQTKNKFGESISQLTTQKKHLITVGERYDKIKAIKMKENLVPSVFIAGSAGDELGAIQQQQGYFDGGPPMLVGEQGASGGSLVPLGVPSFFFHHKLPSVDLVSSTEKEKKIFLNDDVKGKTARVRKKKNSIDITKILRPPEGEDYPQGSCLENELKSPSNDDENSTKENKVNSNTTTEESLMYTSTERSMRMKEKIKKFIIKTSRGNIKIKTVNIC